jgi:hypothetical protein
MNRYCAYCRVILICRFSLQCSQIRALNTLQSYTSVNHEGRYIYRYIQVYATECLSEDA